MGLLTSLGPFRLDRMSPDYSGHAADMTGGIAPRMNMLPSYAAILFVIWRRSCAEWRLDEPNEAACARAPFTSYLGGTSTAGHIRISR